MKYFLFFVLLFILNSCARFKVDDLNSTLLGRIKIGNQLQDVEGSIVNKIPINIPVYIPVNSGKIFISDFSNSLIKVFNNSGKLDYIIGSPNTKEETLKILSYKFSLIGMMAISGDGDVYVQNRLITKDKKEVPKEANIYQKNSGLLEVPNLVSLPSYILHINKSGTPESMIGVTGRNSEPFRNIEKIYAFQEKRLAVYYKHIAEYILGFYENGDLIGTIKESELQIVQGDESKKYSIKMDTIIPHKSGKYALVSFTYLSPEEDRFKFRRIYKFALDKTEPEKLLKEIYDPSEVLFAVKGNQEFLIWETEENGNSVKLQVHDDNGYHLNNKRMYFPPPRGNWRETYIDGMDNIYSIAIQDGYIEVYQWL